MIPDIPLLSGKDTICKPTHILPYNYDEVLTVKLMSIEKPEFAGYANVLLSPLLQYPKTKHKIKVNLIRQNKSRSI